MVATIAMSSSAHAQAPARERVDGPAGSLVLIDTAHELPIVDFAFVLRTGASRDPEAKLGLTRVLARMMRMGTRAMVSSEVDEQIDALGAQLAITVTPSSIRFEGTVIRRNLDAFVELFARLVLAPALRVDDLERVKRETFAEILETLDDDRALAAQEFRARLFRQHPYARPVIGTRTTVERIARADLVAAHRELIVGGNVIFGFAGDVDAAHAARLVRRHFARLPAGAAPIDALSAPSVERGRRLTIVDKPERTQTQIYIGTLGASLADDDHIALLVANTVFGGTFTARLMRAVRSERGWSYGAYSRLAFDRAREAWSMWTFPAATDAAACIRLKLELFEALVREGISAEELEFAKNYLVNSYAFDIDTASERLDQRIDVEVLGLPRDYYDQYTRRIAAVTLDQANRALRARLDPTALEITVVATAAELGEALRALPGLTDVTVVPFDDAN